MTTKPTTQRPPPREALSRQRVVASAVTLADTDGIGALTMRRLGQALGVEAMSLYNHVANKDDVLDAMVDAVFAEITLPEEGVGWRPAIQERCRSARAALVRHPWAVGLMESRTTPGPATLTHHDRVLGTLRGNGFSLPAAAHAVALLDSYVYGFALQETTLPFTSPEETSDLAESLVAQMPPDAYPHLTEMATDHVMRPGYDFADEFEIGLEVILDGLARISDTSGRAR